MPLMIIITSVQQIQTEDFKTGRLKSCYHYHHNHILQAKGSVIETRQSVIWANGSAR